MGDGNLNTKKTITGKEYEIRFKNQIPTSIHETSS